MSAATDTCPSAAGIFIVGNVSWIMSFCFKKITKSLKNIRISNMKFVFRLVLFLKILYDIIRIGNNLSETFGRRIKSSDKRKSKTVKSAAGRTGWACDYYLLCTGLVYSF